MTKVDMDRIKRIEREEWEHSHPGWWQERCLRSILIIILVLIGLMVIYWSGVHQATVVEAAVFHKEADTILYVGKLDTDKAEKPEFPPEAIVVDNSSPSDAEAEIGENDNARSEVSEEEEWVSLGKWKLSFYCPCRRCSGKWGYRTSSGATCQEGVTVACAILPAGTEVMIEGYGHRIVQDTGAGVRGQHLDVFMESHSECLRHGIKYREVWVKK